MKEAEIVPLFSKPLYRNKIDLDVSKFYPIIDTFKFKTVGRYLEDNFASQTLDNKVLEKKELHELRDVVVEHFNNYAYNLLKFKNKFKMTTSWFTKAFYTEGARYHNHNNCMFSGVVYLKTSKEKAHISFENFATKRFHVEAHEYNTYNCAEITFTQSEKDILIFPSETHHKICRNKGRGERISLAFNFIPIGRIGIEGEDSFCEIY